jgi:TPR repeat protein
VAVELYPRVIERGSVCAMNKLGVILEREGKAEEGIQLIERAAKADDDYAMHNLAIAIQNGQFASDIEAVPAPSRGSQEGR